MNQNKGSKQSWTSLLQPLPFRFIVKEPLAKSVEILQSNHELHIIGPSHYVKIDTIDEQSPIFSIYQPRRIIPIRAVGNLTSISATSTEITGDIRADLAPFGLLGIFVLVVLAFVVFSAESNALCFIPLTFLILVAGTAIEMISQYYAKLGLFTFLKRMFDTEDATGNRTSS